jgi:hypothetical protein
MYLIKTQQLFERSSCLLECSVKFILINLTIAGNDSIGAFKIRESHYIWKTPREIIDM